MNAGGQYTTDVLLLRNGKPDLQFCRSLECGTITMNNEIIRKINARYDLRIDDEHISAVLNSEETILPAEVKAEILLKAYLNSEYNCFAALNKNKSGENFCYLRDLRQQRVFLKSEGILMHCTLTINKYLTTSTIPRQGADSFGVRQPSSVKIAFGNRCAMICFGIMRLP